jgi:hypothetical protein
VSRGTRFEPRETKATKPPCAEIPDAALSSFADCPPAVDLLALFTWLRTNAWWGDVTFRQQQFGYDITSSSGGLTPTTPRLCVGYTHLCA